MCATASWLRAFRIQDLYEPWVPFCLGMLILLYTPDNNKAEFQNKNMQWCYEKLLGHRCKLDLTGCWRARQDSPPLEALLHWHPGIFCPMSKWGNSFPRAWFLWLIAQIGTGLTRHGKSCTGNQNGAVIASFACDGVNIVWLESYLAYQYHKL